MIIIRRASEGDADKVHGLLGQPDYSKMPHLDRFREIFYRNLYDPDIIFLVAEIDGGVVGFGSLYLSMQLQHCKPVAEIRDLAVNDHAHNMSVGAQLVNAMLLLARDRDCSCLEAYTERACKKSHQFFAKHGFTFTHFKLTLDMNLKVID